MNKILRRRSLSHDAPIAPAQPTLRHAPPRGDGWVYEIKHDGYRIVAVRNGEAVHLWSRSGRDWADSLPGIRDALLSLLAAEFIIDGEAVAIGPDGLPDFHGLRSRDGRSRAVLYAFDLLSLDGDDLRRRPLLERKAALARLIAGVDDRLRYVEHLAGDGPTIFAHASALGLEGIVSKRADLSYTNGATRDWIKTRNPAYGRRSFRR